MGHSRLLVVCMYSIITRMYPAQALLHKNVFGSVSRSCSTNSHWADEKVTGIHWLSHFCFDLQKYQQGTMCAFSDYGWRTKFARFWRKPTPCYLPTTSSLVFRVRSCFLSNACPFAPFRGYGDGLYWRPSTKNVEKWAFLKNGELKQTSLLPPFTKCNAKWC